MVEHPSHAEVGSTMTTATVQSNDWMSGDRCGCSYTVAGVTSVSGNRCCVMIRLGIGKAVRVMAGTAVGDRVMGEIRV